MRGAAMFLFFLALKPNSNFKIYIPQFLATFAKQNQIK